MGGRGGLRRCCCCTATLTIGLSELVLHDLLAPRGHHHSQDQRRRAASVLRRRRVRRRVGLTVAYRRQRDLEANQLTIDFGAAVAQFGVADAAVRLGGVYAMATLAERYPERRQQCIVVLCAYVRLPSTSPRPGRRSARHHHRQAHLYQGPGLLERRE